ncbi:MAG: L,D-transpeptidase family protein [Rhodospirillales bacterium]
MDIRLDPAGYVLWGDCSYRAVYGRGGIRTKGGEGDGITPIGSHPLRWVYYRPDRFAHRPPSGLEVRALAPDDGWCDAPDHPCYNQPIKKPFPVSHEDLWRDDGVYDLIVVVGYNDDPILAGAGSAIFIHVARPDFSPTEGCVALARAHLEVLVAGLTPRSRLIV